MRRPARSASPRHGPLAQLLIAWSPLSALLLAYAVAGWIDSPLGRRAHAADSNRLGFAVHLTEPPDVDRAVFGEVPSVWLQAHLADGTAHWYDAVGALVYVTHFVALPVVTAVVWFRWRDRFRGWVAAVLTFTVVGIGLYVVYPAAPPWLASDHGEIGSVHRISSLGWDYLHLGFAARLSVHGQGGSDPVAAMPSLHAGAALLVALFLWPVASGVARVVLVAYALLMALTLVYTGEHYVVDVVAGWVTAAVAVLAGSAALTGPSRAD